MSFGLASSGEFTTSRAGVYRWVATFSGRGGLPAVSGSCGDASETTLVAKAAPSLTNSVKDAATDNPWDGTQRTGAKAYDSAVLTDTVAGITPTGTVTYDLYSSDDCSGSPTAEQVNLTNIGSVPSSATTAPLAAGSYSYQATYSGDPNYDSATSGCADFGVGKAAPSLANGVKDAATDNPWDGTQTNGAQAYDTAVLTGTVAAFTPTGTVAYNLYSSGDCSGSPAHEQVNLANDGSVPRSATTAALTAGSYSYQAAYLGDPNYAPATSDCADFGVGVAQADPRPPRRPTHPRRPKRPRRRSGISRPTQSATAPTFASARRFQARPSSASSTRNSHSRVARPSYTAGSNQAAMSLRCSPPRRRESAIRPRRRRAFESWRLASPVGTRLTFGIEQASTSGDPPRTSLYELHGPERLVHLETRPRTSEFESRLLAPMPSRTESRPTVWGEAPTEALSLGYGSEARKEMTAAGPLGCSGLIHA